MVKVDYKNLELKVDEMGNMDITKPLLKACILVENEAKRKVPVDTGILRDSITHEIEVNIGVVGTNVEYAPYVEYGTGLFARDGNGRQDVPWHYQDAKGNWHSTVGQHPQPYLEPALLENKELILQIFKDALSEELNNDK